jgi:hypothetical protein
MAKKQPDLGGIFKRTEPEQPQEEKPEDPVKPRGIGLRESEWQRLEEIAGELGMTAHAVAMYAIRDFVRRFEKGEIRTETKRALPGL